jgi:hypothetical protein
VIRTRQTAEPLSPADTVRGYKSLAQVEHACRSLKGLDLLIRPIRHCTEERVPAHIFLCVLAYYVECHLRRGWAPLLFEEQHSPDLELNGLGIKEFTDRTKSKRGGKSSPVLTEC